MCFSVPSLFCNVTHALTKGILQIGFNLRKVMKHVEFSELLDLAPCCSSLCPVSTERILLVLQQLFATIVAMMITSRRK